MQIIRLHLSPPSHIQNVATRVPKVSPSLSEVDESQQLIFHHIASLIYFPIHALEALIMQFYRIWKNRNPELDLLKIPNRRPEDVIEDHVRNRRREHRFKLKLRVFRSLLYRRSTDYSTEADRLSMKSITISWLSI